MWTALTERNAFSSRCASAAFANGAPFYAARNSRTRVCALETRCIIARSFRRSERVDAFWRWKQKWLSPLRRLRAAIGQRTAPSHHHPPTFGARLDKGAARGHRDSARASARMRGDWGPVSLYMLRYHHIEVFLATIRPNRNF